MELISKVSKGSNMDQVYIPKHRNGFSIGSYVILSPVEEKVIKKPYFYNVKFIEPIKLEIINEIFCIIERLIENENIIITGSFLDEGFNFNDIDILLISKNKIDEKHIIKKLEDEIKIKIHLIIIDNQALAYGLERDPLYQIMLSKCIAKKRFIYKIKPKIDYKLLDLHLLKSRLLIDNFDFLNGNEKYYLIRNMMTILLYSNHRKINKEDIDLEIERIFNIKVQEIKQNMLEKNKFLKKYKAVYKKIFNKVINGINGSKQK